MDTHIYSAELQKIIQEAERKKSEEAKKYYALAQFIATIMPPLDGLTNKEKRTVICNCSGQQADKQDNIAHYKLYSLVCNILARDYGLNDES